MLVPIAISVVILAAMVYMAVSRKSSFKIRLAALGALALMIITVIVCLISVFRNAASGAKTQVYPDMPATAVQPPNSMVLFSFIFFLLVVFVVVLLLSLREQRRAANAANSNDSIDPSKGKFSIDSL